MSSDSDQHSSSSRRNYSRSRSKDREGRKPNESRSVRIKAPDFSEPLVSFKHFSSLQTERLSSEIVQAAYDRYKNEFQKRQNDQFLSQYSQDPWFIERYDPEAQEVFERARKETVQKAHFAFITRLKEKFYDSIDLRVKEPASLGSLIQPDKEDDDTLINFQSCEIHVLSSVDVTKAPFFGFDSDSCTLFIKSVPRTISRSDILEKVSSLPGFKDLTMSDPVKKLNLTRYCWIQFESEKAASSAELAMNGLIIKQEPLIVSKSLGKAKRVKVLKNYPSSRTQADKETSLRLVQTLDAECGIESNELRFQNGRSDRQQLDLLLLYLRRVHGYDYFASAHFENERILSLKIGSIFLRVEADYEEVAGYYTVFKKVQDHAVKRIQKGPEKVDSLVLLREEIEKLIREGEKIGKDQPKDSWKCMYCDKKFKSCEFLAKHILSKHHEIKAIKIKSMMELAYIRDPAKITLASLRDERDFKGRKPFQNYRRDRRREYKDLDQPESERPVKTLVKPMINFLDI